MLRYGTRASTTPTPPDRPEYEPSGCGAKRKFSRHNRTGAGKGDAMIRLASPAWEKAKGVPGTDFAIAGAFSGTGVRREVIAHVEAFELGGHGEIRRAFQRRFVFRWCSEEA